MYIYIILVRMYMYVHVYVLSLALFHKPFLDLRSFVVWHVHVSCMIVRE